MNQRCMGRYLLRSGSVAAAKRLGAHLNQDAFVIHEKGDRILTAVSDGVSSCPFGREAAQYVTAQLPDLLLSKVGNAEASEAACNVIESLDQIHAELTHKHGAMQAMCTIAGVMLWPDRSYIAFAIGDSVVWGQSKTGAAPLLRPTIRMVPVLVNGRTQVVAGMPLLTPGMTSVLGDGRLLEIEQCTGRLETGDFLLLATDGIAQTRFGRLTDTGLSAEGWEAYLCDSTRETRDDATCVALHALPMSEPAILGKLAAVSLRGTPESKIVFTEQFSDWTLLGSDAWRDWLMNEQDESVGLFLYDVLHTALAREELIRLADYSAASSRKRLLSRCLRSLATKS